MSSVELMNSAMMNRCWMLACLLAACLGGKGLAEASRPNGFDLSRATIPVTDILDGGVGKGGVPAIDRPKFLPAAAVDFMGDGETVISFTGKKGETRAYPIRILIQHEIVNDKMEGQAFMVSYCPLCASAMVFDAAIDGKELIFGVSGLLYHSDVLMYDRESQSLWSQLGMRSVSGPNVGKKLKWLASEQMSFGVWKKKYPLGKVLSTETGFMRNYQSSGYRDYFESPDTVFPVPYTRKEFPKKTYVAGLIVNGKAMAFPLRKMPRGKLLEVEVGQQTIKVIYEKNSRLLKAFEADGQTLIPVVVAYWFAWQAFYPETEIWKN